MKEIKFRGKRLDNGEWVYGDLNDWSYSPKIVVPSEGATYDVDPKTVGWYTGLKDKNGKEIYEGDILQDHHVIHNDGSKNDPYVVEWQDYSNDIEVGMVGLSVGWLEQSDIEVIGNLYENPELLK